MKKFLTTFFILLAVAALGCAVFFTFFFLKWNECSQTASTPEIIQTEFSEKEKKIAQQIPFKITAESSWNLIPVSAEIVQHTGVQEGKPSVILPGKWKWGTRQWEITLWIQPYHLGKIKETEALITFEGGPDGKYTLKTKIPAFQVISSGGNETQTLWTADEAAVPEKFPGIAFWIITAVIILAAIILWIFLRKAPGTAAAETPAWQQALDSIAELKESMQLKKISPEQAIGKLTDIVRAFLEKQFSLRAERQTTPEFLESLKKDSSALDLEQRRFLKEFLSSADMIKFARLPAEESLFEQTSQRAEALIKHAIPTTDGKENIS